MAEIKSTLDLVMERTRNFKMSDEEKRERAAAEFATRVKGMLYRFEDGLLTPERFDEELGSLQAEFDLPDKAVAIEEVVRKLDLEKDNSGLLALLEVVAGAAARQVESILDRHAEALRNFELEARRRHLAVLADAGISGSAVVPNLSEDGEFDMKKERTRASFEAELKRWTAEANLRMPAR